MQEMPIEEITPSHVELILNQTQAVESRIPIRWCIHQDILDYLQYTVKKTKPALLVVISHKENEVSRYIFPLHQLMSFIDFDRAGEHTITATIVWLGYKDSFRELKKCFLRQNSERQYDRQLISQGELVSDLAKCFGAIGTTSLQLSVADGFFAKEPPAWLNNWVNWLFKTKPRDQCQFRKRCIFAFSLQLFVIAPLFLCLFFAICTIFIVINLLKRLLLLLCGVRQPNWRDGLRLHNLTEIPESMPDHGSSIFIKDAKGNFRSPILIIFTPLLWLSISACYTIFRLVDPNLTHSHSKILIWIAIGLFAFVITINWLAQLVDRFIEDDDWREKRRKRDEERQQKYMARYYNQMSGYAVCKPNMHADLDSLPLEKQTVYLQYLDLKAQLCKPFAKR